MKIPRFENTQQRTNQPGDAAFERVKWKVVHSFLSKFITQSLLRTSRREAFTLLIAFHIWSRRLFVFITWCIVFCCWEGSMTKGIRNLDWWTWRWFSFHAHVYLRYNFSVLVHQQQYSFSNNCGKEFKLIPGVPVNNLPWLLTIYGLFVNVFKYCCWNGLFTWIFIVIKYSLIHIR